MLFSQKWGEFRVLRQSGTGPHGCMGEPMVGQAVICDPIFEGQGCQALLRNAPGSGNFGAIFISTWPLEGSGFCWATFSGEQWSSLHFAEAAGRPWGSVYGVRVGVCPGLGPEGWLRWSAHPFGGGEYRAHAQDPTFAPRSSEVAVGFWFLDFLYLVHTLPQLCRGCSSF